MTDTASSEAPPVDGVAIEVNGVEVVANKGELVIDAAERHGVYIPRFCYHPRMKPVGMCRMCIVEIDTGRGPALQPSCMLEATPGMKVNTNSPVTKKAQDGVLEFLLINHPLDCPVCDKGGECPLQDQTMAYGPGESRYVEEKRHKEKPIPISDIVLLDRERCILCDRCTRFAKEVAGDPLIHFINRGNDTEINTFPDEPFSSYFSGNTVQICPVGALTAKPYRFKARPWDLDQRESTCQSCSVGCRIAIQSSSNHVVRYLGVDIEAVNWGWLCDRGRFDFEAVNSDERLTHPLVRNSTTTSVEPAARFDSARWGDALRSSAGAIKKAMNGTGPGSVAIIGGARLTNEDAFAWAKLAKGVIGTDNVDCQLGDGLPAELVLGLPAATINEVCRPGGTVILATADIKEELPILFLRLRHAVVNDKVTVIELASQRSGFSDLAAVSLLHRPGEVAETARALVDTAGTIDAGGVDGDALAKARALLQGADAPSVVIGRASIAESADFTVDAAGVFRAALPDARFLPAVRRGNVRGALDMGLAPGFLPGRVTLDTGRATFSSWPTLPAERGLDTAGILAAAADGAIEVLVLLGADPLCDFPDRDLATRALAKVPTVIAVDQFLTESVQQAQVVFPAAGFAEVDGTTTNIEGRVSVLNQKVTPPGTARTDWMIAAELSRQLGVDLGLESNEQIWAEIVGTAPAYRGVTPEDLGGPVAGDGVLVPLPLPTVRRNGTSAEDADGDRTADEAGSDGGSDHAVNAVPESATADEVAAAEGASEQAAPASEADDTAVTTGPQDEADASGLTAQPDDASELFRFEPGPAAELAAVDAYGLRLVATRKLYDLGTYVQQSPALAELAPGTVLRVNPYDFDRLGVADGAQVRLRSAKATVTVEIAVDTAVPRGAAAIYTNQPGLDAGDLIDVTQRVTDVRVDSGTTGGEASA